jgi:hypothetical protein
VAASSARDQVSHEQEAPCFKQSCNFMFYSTISAMPSGEATVAVRQESCPERKKLETAMAQAVMARYAASGDSWMRAHRAEMEALQELDSHIRQHGCNKP